MIVFNFNELWGETQHFFLDGKPEEIYQQEYLERCRKNPQFEGRNINLVQLARIDIVYHIIFFGLSREDQQTISGRLGRRYDRTFTKNILAYASLKLEQTWTLNPKYFYIKILRVQLSNYEQIAFFLNTVSGLGRAWELEGASPLVTTYNMITNIPSQYIMGDINVRDYYPEVKYADNFMT